MTIQERIDQKAEIELRKLIKEFARELSEKKLFRALDNVKVILPGKTEPESYSLPQLLDEYYTDKGLCQVIFNNLIEKAKSIESAEFYEKIEKMK